MRVIAGAAPFALGLALQISNVAFGQGEAPAGLVMALSGSTTPPLATMAEIPAGTPVQLALGTELTFLHYGRCKLVTISGGTLSLSRSEFTTDGKIVADKDGPCPRIHSIGGNQGGTVTGGLLMRGAGVLPRWPLDPEILLVGAGSDGVQAAAIYAEDRPDTPLAPLDVAGHRLRFAATGERPGVNGRYVLRLTLAGGGDPLDLPFIGAAPDGPQLVVVLRRP
ncbi:MAG TPA: hypothetical protein VM782_12105 [Stellaceae bacterium]|nr:hypothetical protein [Stellaceae bacterium]